MPNYADILLPKVTRSENSIDCNCYICLRARCINHSKNQFVLGQKRNLNNNIDKLNGLYGSSTQKINYTKTVNKPNVKRSAKKVIKLCEKCFQKIGNGLNHSCAHTCEPQTHTIRQNVMKLVNELPDKQKEHVASSILKDISNKVVGDSMRLSTGGRGKTIYFKTNEPNDKILFSTGDLDSFHVNSAVSTNHMRKMSSFIRKTAGRKSVPVKYEQHIRDRSHLLDTFYQKGLFEFETADGNYQTRPVVWANVNELLEEVLKERNLIGYYVVKVMADGGQGFFKVSMSIIPDSENGTVEDYSDSLSNEDIIYNISSKKRKFNQEKLGYKSTSVKKLIMICIVPDIKETYNNIKFLFDLVKLNEVSFKFVSDFKLLLIINGQQTATSMFPCPYCSISLKDLRNFHKIADCQILGHDKSKSLKTYGDLKQDCAKYVSLGKSKKMSKESHSVINEPIFYEDKDVKVLEKCYIPELHLLQGFVNHLFWNGLVLVLGREKALIWPLKLKIISKNYHGEIFEGNACRKLLKEADALCDKIIYENVGILALVPFISAFKAMNKMVNLCFSTERRGSIDALDKIIEELKKALLATGVSITLKIHVLLEHVKPTLSLLKNSEGLGKWSEQAGESVHREFLSFWEKHKINLINDPSYSQRLKAATVQFSSFHI
ncbi:unnamed protein product [Brassicogethes aeneus]|uniref:Uncharacterized protein n=1 Tax=Brassicogethes aeneus TaxID=1431903 RepID=A0A9P0B0X1_BRAAE|nr:unnamed protein product [Brassicogethes aeneus]